MCSFRIASACAFAEMSSTGAAGAAYGLNAVLLMFSPLLCHPFGNWSSCFVQRLADDVDERRFARRQRLAQDFFQLARLGHAPAPDPEALGDLRVIGHAEIHREIALLVAGFLPRLD